jgi:hypothetical protein
MLFLFALHAMAMNFADRFYFQLTLPIVLLFFVTEDVVDNARIATLLAAVFVLGISPSFLKSSLSYFPDLLRGQGDIGRRLAPFAPGHIMLTGEAGLLPYASGWVSYDLFGLGTHEFAGHPPTRAQLQALHPDLVLVFANRPGPAVLDETRSAVAPTSVDAANFAVLDYLSAARLQYQYAGSSLCNGFYLTSFLRSDTPDHDAILAALQQNAIASAETHLSVRKLLLQQYVPWSR